MPRTFLVVASQYPLIFKKGRNPLPGKVRGISEKNLPQKTNSHRNEKPVFPSAGVLFLWEEISLFESELGISLWLPSEKAEACVIKAKFSIAAQPAHFEADAAQFFGDLGAVVKLQPMHFFSPPIKLSNLPKSPHASRQYLRVLVFLGLQENRPILPF
jgi:hypothetical protein